MLRATIEGAHYFPVGLAGDNFSGRRSSTVAFAHHYYVVLSEFLAPNGVAVDSIVHATTLLFHPHFHGGRSGSSASNRASRVSMYSPANVPAKKRGRASSKNRCHDSSS